MRSQEEIKLAKEHLRIYSQLRRDLITLGCAAQSANNAALDLRDRFTALRREKHKIERERPPNQVREILGRIKRIQKGIDKLLELPSRKNLPIGRPVGPWVTPNEVMTEVGV